jgi:hypothetical protein
MSTEIAVPPPTSLESKMRYAQALATSNLLPKQYQRQPANLLFALEYADALGVSPIHAITSIHVISGKPSASADLIAALIRRAGHKLRVTGDDTTARAVLIRHDDPEFEFVAEWNMAKAKQAGLNTATWKAYPAAMLRSRAITEVARMGAPDALFGVIYTPEELGAEVNAEGEVVDVPAYVVPDVVDEAPAEQSEAATETVNRYRHQPQQDEPVAQVDWSGAFAAAKGNHDSLVALRNQGRRAGLSASFGMFSAIEEALTKLASETPVEGTVI